MTTHKEALKLALEALEIEQAALAYEHGKVEHIENAITAIKEALAQPKEPKHIGTVDKDDFGLVGVLDEGHGLEVGDKLYDAPQRKPLTDDEAFKLIEQDYQMEEYAQAALQLIRRTEVAHGIKD